MTSFIVNGIDGSVDYSAEVFDHKDMQFLQNLNFVVNWAQQKIETDNRYKSSVRNELLRRFRCVTIRGEQSISLKQLKKYLLKNEYEKLAKKTKYIPLSKILDNITGSNKLFLKSFLMEF